MSGPLSEDLELFEAIYDSALFPEHFTVLVDAWDASFRHLGVSTAAAARLAELEALGLRRHFERAGQIFAATEPRQSQDLGEFIESQRTASMLTTTAGRILATNAAAIGAFGVKAGDDIAAVPLEANSAWRVQAAVTKLANLKGARENVVALSGVRQDNGKVFIVVIERMAAGAFGRNPEPLFLFRSTLACWDTRVSALLQSAFDLTLAELQIIELLNEGMRLDEIAHRRGRSEKTVRTQLRSINQKTRTNSQTELMRHVSSLIIMAGELHGFGEEAALVEDATPQLEQGLVAGGRSIHYVDQGVGPAVLCCFPTMPPLQGAPYESALTAAGLRRVALYKAGTGRSPSAPKPLLPSQQVQDLHRLVMHLNITSLVLLGHCAGGVLALEFAERFPALVRAVVLLDTGAPLQQQAQWDAMPDSASRTFFLARHSPELLVTPHKLVAANFASGPDGKRQTVEYFYGGQGNDLTLLEEPALYAWACQMLEYCLADPEQIVRDVQSWSSDWSSLVRSVADRCPVVFVHGDENQQFPIADLEAFCEGHRNMRTVVAPGAAQLTLRTHGELVVEVLAGVAAYAK